MIAMTQTHLLLYLLIINVLAFVMFWIDKRQSKAKLQRIRERTLLLLAFWGGSLGALLAQQFFRHKTRKEPFRSNLIVIAIWHIALLCAFANPFSRAFILKLVW
jgi:uncharacterized membrane protein YsdA (DUF1294 family)